MAKAKRDLFGEMMEGVQAMRGHREGKVTLKTFHFEAEPVLKVDAALIRRIRKELDVSQGVFARMLRVNPRTLANWEQGRSLPNDQAAMLILMVRKYPDTVERLRSLAA